MAAVAQGLAHPAAPALGSLQPSQAVDLLDQWILKLLVALALLIVVARIIALVGRLAPGRQRVGAWVGPKFVKATPWSQAERDPATTHLLVVAHAFASSPGRMQGVVDVALETLAAQGLRADVLWLQAPAIGLGSLICNACPHDAASQSAAIVAKCTARGYERLILIGHSAGAVLLKKAWLFNHPRFGLDRPQSSVDANQSRRTIDGAEFPWWARVERFVFLAGLGGGWDDQDRTLVHLLVGLARLFGSCRWVLALRRGEPFIENMRVEWLAAFRQGVKTPAEAVSRSDAAAMRLKSRGSDETADDDPDAVRRPLIVQLVGTRDTWIDAGSDLDIAAAPERFVFLRVEETDHPNIIDVQVRAGSPPDQAVQFRRTAVVTALTLTDEEARARERSLRTEAEDPEMDRRARVKHVVVVLHGIRDEGSWAGQFRDIITGSGQGRLGLSHVHVSSERFPWIPMLSFMLNIGGAREKNVRWLADKYVRLTAQYPRLERISFIGHSYGTYVFANCLQRYATIRFQNVFLAGSVLPRNFSWTALRDEGRFVRLCNAVASADDVVAIFPGFFEWLRRWFGGLNRSQFFGLGDAGFAGFEQQAANSEELTYLRGGHDAFLKAPSAPQFAATYVVQDELHAPESAVQAARSTLIADGGLVSTRDKTIVNANHLVVLIWALALFGLLAIIWLASAGIHCLANWGDDRSLLDVWRPSPLAALLLLGGLFIFLNSL